VILAGGMNRKLDLRSMNKLGKGGQSETKETQRTGKSIKSLLTGGKGGGDFIR
jgi:hypothetical protein